MILRYLAAVDGECVSQRDIEREFGIRRSTVTSVLQLMEKNGFIRRFRDEKDGRLKRIEITDAGIDANCRVRGTVTAFEERLVKDLTAERRTQLFEILTELENSLEKIENEAKAGHHL